MKIISKHYVEEFRPRSNGRLSNFDSIVHTVSERDPLKYSNSHLVSFFRFFDRAEAILDDGKVLYGKRKNYSCVYYCGERLNKNELNELGIFWKNFFLEQGINSVIKCYNGKLITNPIDGSMTIDEFKKWIQTVEQILEDDIEQNYDDENLENAVNQIGKGPIFKKIRK
jgi:hypothetical protein